jgi:CheY-like chemotaxis protein
MNTGIAVICVVASASFAGAASPTPAAQLPDEYLKLLAQEAEARRELVDSLRVAASSRQNSMTASPDPIILKYSEALRADAKDHREFVEGLYRMTAAILSAAFIAFGGVFAWMNWKTRSDIKKEVDNQFRQHAKSLVEERTHDFMRFLEERTKEVEKQMKGVNSLLFSLASQSAVAAVESPRSPVELHTKRVLWVDDFPGNNDYIRTVLEQQGVLFTLALSTKEGIDNLERQKFDLVISDMGRGSDSQAGLHLLQQMKQKQLNVPVIIFASSSAVARYIEQARQLGAHAVTSSVQALLQGVSEVLT